VSIFVRLATVGAAAFTTAGFWLLTAPQPANAVDLSAPAPVVRQSSVGCGYDGQVNGRPTYNHCGVGSVVIEVDHFFWQHTYACMPKGVHVIPQGNSQWTIIGAEYDGHNCASTQPISVTGP
jgi:hypothetical protein